MFRIKIKTFISDIQSQEGKLSSGLQENNDYYQRTGLHKKIYSRKKCCSLQKYQLSRVIYVCRQAPMNLFTVNRGKRFDQYRKQTEQAPLNMGSDIVLRFATLKPNLSNRYTIPFIVCCKNQIMICCRFEIEQGLLKKLLSHYFSRFWWQLWSRKNTPFLA